MAEITNVTAQNCNTTDLSQVSLAALGAELLRRKPHTMLYIEAGDLRYHRIKCMGTVILLASGELNPDLAPADAERWFSQLAEAAAEFARRVEVLSDG